VVLAASTTARRAVDFTIASLTLAFLEEEEFRV